MIADILPRYQEVANGTKKAFTVPFDILDSSYINVYLGSTKQTSGFSINVSGKKVTFTTPPSSSTVVTIVRVIPTSWEQEVLGAVNAETLNNIFTVLIAKMQTLEEGLNRAIKTDVTDTETGSTHFLELLEDAIDSLSQANTKLAQVQSSATQALSDISDAETTALSNFNSNATSKTNTFNSNYNTKKAAIDTKATEAADSAALAKQWAIGDPSEPGGHSAKYWAEQAAVVTEDVVHKTGNETVGGTKTFSSYIKATSQIDETSTSNQERSYIELSDNQATTGYIRQYWSTTQNQLRIRTLARHGEAAGSWGDIQQIIDNNGNYKINISCQGTLVNTAVTGATNSTTNGEIPTKGWVNNPATSTNVVHRTDDETIGGEKTFTSAIIRSFSANAGGLSGINSSIQKGTTPSTVQQFFTGLYDKNGSSTYTNTISRVNFKYDSNGDTKAELNVFAPTASSTATASLGIAYPTSGSAYTYAPTPATSDDSTKIATTAFVKAQGYASDSAVVKTSGTQTISGLKTFTAQVTKTNSSAGADTIFVNKNTSITKGTPPSANVESRWRLTDSSTGDSNSAFIGGVTFGYATNMRTSALLQVGKPEAGSTSTSTLGIYYPATGDPYTSAPTPATSDNSTKIATTAYVQAQDYATTTYADGLVGNARYATSTTAAATVEKVVSIPEITSLNVGQCIIVQPTITSTVADSTIKLNDFTAYPMRYNNAAITTSTDSIVWNSAYPTVWLFNGTYWVFITHGVDSNTTYSAMSVAEGIAGTATSNRVMRADYLAQILEGKGYLSASNLVTADAIVSYSLGTNGYIKFSNDCIIQWGTTTSAAAGTAITLPTPFATTNYSVTITSIGDTGVYQRLVSANTPKTTTKFTTYTSGGAASDNFSWQAIGK